MQYLFWFAVFFMVWWIGLLAVLPWGVRTQVESGKVINGTAPSAPIKFKLAKVFIINTILACVVTLGVQQMVDNSNISIRPLLKFIGAPVERGF